MIKSCKVLYNGKRVTVFEYDGVEVQIPAIGYETETLNVNFEDGKYTIVDTVAENEKSKKKKTKKVAEVTEETVEDSDSDIAAEDVEVENGTAVSS